MSSLQKSKQTLQAQEQLTASLNLASGILKQGVQLAVIENKLTMADCLKRPILRNLFKNKDHECFNVVGVLVKRFVDSFGFATKLTPMQVELLAVDAVEHFSYETLEDIVLFLRMSRTGKFGTTKRGIDSNKIFGEWYPMYLEIKAQERERFVAKEKMRLQTVINEKQAQETYKKAREVKIQQYKESAIQAFIDDTVRDFDRQILEDTIVSWSKEDDLKVYVPLLKRKRSVIKE